MLKIQALTKTFSDGAATAVAVDNLDLTVEKGEWVTLLGPSGCGKTTTLRCVAGLETADSGEITIGDRAVYSGDRRISEPPNRRPISMVFQSYAIWPHLSVFKNVAFPLETVRANRREEITSRVNDVLRVVGIEQMAQRDATRLSGGQQQRVALARAIVKHSDLLLLDEPLSNLDAKLRLEMRSELRSLRERIGMTTLHVTHDQEEALSLADRIVLLRAGRIVEEGTPADLYHRPQQSFTASFLGSAELWDAQSVSRDGSGVIVKTAAGTFRAEIHHDHIGGSQQFMVRPEHMAMGSEAEFGSRQNALRGKVTSRMFTGKRAEYTVDIGSSVVRIDRPSTESWDIGDDVVLWLPPELCVLVENSEASHRHQVA